MEMTASPIVGYLFTYQNSTKEFLSLILRDMIPKAFEQN